jgi:NAD(P)H-dependent FMN reductase
MTVDVIDLADARLPDVLADKPAPEVAAITPRLANADVFVVVTPEYNHSFPAPLKNAIDWHFKEWRAKPVGFVSYGGISGGLRAVEQLRQVFAELHAVTVRDTVSFHGAWTQFDSEGRPKDPERYEKGTPSMLDQLAWWGQALREARSQRPYVTR